MDNSLDQHLNLNWLRSFECVARLSGFTAASKELGLTQTAVSQHIKALETKLGHNLFIRQAKSIHLTEIGKAYLPSVRNALASLTLSTNGLFGPTLKSTIVIRASMGAILWITPKLRDFQLRHPDIGIKLVTIIWADTLDTQIADIEILLAPSTQADIGFDKLSDEFIVPVCDTNTAKAIKSAADLKTRNPIHIQGFDDHWARYMAAFGHQHDHKSTKLIVDTSIAAAELVASGAGCAIMIERFAIDSIRMGQSIEIVGDRVPLYQSHFLTAKVASKDKQAAVSALKEWLHAQFAEATVQD